MVEPFEYEVAPFLTSFSSIEDPRISRKKLYPLIEVIFGAFVATLCGARGWRDIEDFCELKLHVLRKFLPYEKGIASYVTFSRCFAILDPKAFEKAFIEWMASCKAGSTGVISVDGKTLRGSFDTAKGLKPIHMLNAFSSNIRIVLGQEKVDDKSNEITAIPSLLDLLAIKGAVITIDAMGCQKGIARHIREKKADYILALKGNQGELKDNIETFFSQEDLNDKKIFDTCKSFDKGHGRIEVRTCWATADINWLPGRDDWRDLKSIVMIESIRKLPNKETSEKRFFISSLPADSAMLLHAIRSHWEIENTLHWTLDMVFREDDSRIRNRNASQVMALFRRLSINILRMLPEKESVGIKRRRNRAAWCDSYLERVILQTF
jgi:predicted transposase YbfD/YdcC